MGFLCDCLQFRSSGSRLNSATVEMRRGRMFTITASAPSVGENSTCDFTKTVVKTLSNEQKSLLKHPQKPEMTSWYLWNSCLGSGLPQWYQDFEQGVWWRLVISIDGSGQAPYGFFDVNSEGFFYHLIHLVYVGGPVLLHLDTKEEIPQSVKK